jgi:hypothetical protein
MPFGKIIGVNVRIAPNIHTLCGKMHSVTAGGTSTVNLLSLPTVLADSNW